MLPPRDWTSPPWAVQKLDGIHQAPEALPRHLSDVYSKRFSSVLRAT